MPKRNINHPNLGHVYFTVNGRLPSEKPDAICILHCRRTRRTRWLPEILNVLSLRHPVGTRRTCGAVSPPERDRGQGPRCGAGSFVTAYHTGGAAENLAFRHTHKVGLLIWTRAKCGREAVDASYSIICAFVCRTSRVKLFDIDTVFVFVLGNDLSEPTIKWSVDDGRPKMIYLFDYGQKLKITDFYPPCSYDEIVPTTFIIFLFAFRIYPSFG